MKKFLTILLACSMALVANALAQQDEEQNQKKGHGRAEAAQESGAATQGGQNTKQGRGRHQQGQTNAQTTTNGSTGQQSAGTNQQATPGANAHARGRGHRGGNAETTATAAPNAANATTGAGDNANVTSGNQGKQGRNGRRARGEKAATNAPTNPSPATAGASASPAAEQTNTASAQAPNQGGGKGRKLDPQRVQTIKSQHASFKAQPKPDKVPAVSFNQSHRIEGAESWQGPQYTVFRSYHPEMHDRTWYHSHYSRVELIGGGYYYWNNGYWFPAWGYDPGAQYYAWDGPIYVGHSAVPPDRVIADVQAVLQEEGYYRGEVDGLLGPLTREALTAYQADHGLYTTAAIDEPTLDSLGMS